MCKLIPNFKEEDQRNSQTTSDFKIRIVSKLAETFVCKIRYIYFGKTNKYSMSMHLRCGSHSVENVMDGYEYQRVSIAKDGNRRKLQYLKHPIRHNSSQLQLVI